MLRQKFRVASKIHSINSKNYGSKRVIVNVKREIVGVKRVIVNSKGVFLQFTRGK